jgi:CRISPR-associated endonuclease/helicase Cas3
MSYYSHNKKLSDGSIIGDKLLKEHVDGVLDKVFSSLNPQVDFGWQPEELKSFVKLLVKLHDLGKYTQFFQNYLLDIKPIDFSLKQHSRIGGLTAYNLFKEQDHKKAILLLYLIFMHHSKLTNLTDLGSKINSRLECVFKKQKANINPFLIEIEKELGVKQLANNLFFPDDKQLRLIRRTVKIWSKKEAAIKDYFCTNYFFSLLIESDKLDASKTQQYHPTTLPQTAVDDRFGIPNKLSVKEVTSGVDTNGLRDFCRYEVIKNLADPQILTHHLFTLTAPTGIGKTMIALDFALKLRKKIKKNLGYEARIIYALPFINIIEQALDEYEKTLPDSKILAHYQFADLFGRDKDESKNSNSSTENEEEENYQTKLMSLDTWQADIVITSFVQFFETLIGNQNKLLKKFNHFAGAIIILDEVQTLRLDQMPLIGATLFYLAKFMKSRILLMTATKPKIFDLAQQNILEEEGEIVDTLELLPCYQKVFRAFRRTQIIPLLDLELDGESSNEEFLNKVFKKYWTPKRSCLIVCNTVKRSIELYEKIHHFLVKNDYHNPLHYLSTNVVPIHRLKRIETIKNELKKFSSPILISTQVVEAGVDLDFDMGFRDLGPVDSLIQVAGRINRNNNPNKQNSPLYIIDFKEANKIYGTITSEQVKKALAEKKMFFEQDYLALVSRYFDCISSSNRISFHEFKEIFYAMKSLNYNLVADFKIIAESAWTSTVYIKLADDVIDYEDKHLQMVTGKITREKFDRNYKRDFQQRMITIPTKLTQELDYLHAKEDKIKIAYEALSGHYKPSTGFNRDQQTTYEML